MKAFFFLVVGLAVSSAHTDELEIIDVEEIGQPKDITEINREYNLTDDILEAPMKQRSSGIRDDYLWKSPVPYVLGNDLELNAKGVILRALDEYRLKSCIDFRPWNDEYYYINVKKLNGCHSYIGRVFSGQEISIGRFCDTIAIVQHEFLHALNFYHEQSRYDRDDHVTIRFENIEQGFENNFQRIEKNESTVSGFPYDYDSVMHYGSYAFSNGNGSTIVTKDPKFQDLIGQRQQMSPIDVMELNRRYKCKSTIAFHMYCSFSNESMCGMSNCSNSGNYSGWEMVKQAQGGPKTDHTTLPTNSSENGEEEGYFMHASTASGEEGNISRLVTKVMEPTRECHVQCLQFYYYHSGNESDILNIWTREFDDHLDFEGTPRLMGQITGPQTSHWRIHHVSLNATKFFQVEFEARTGAGSSSGGFSIDDINLSEIECPHGILQIDHYKENNNNRSKIYSPRQYTIDGYAYRIGIQFQRSYFSLVMQMLSGQNDETLEWPLLQRQMTLRMLDQTTNLQLHMSMERSFLTLPKQPNSTGIDLWDNPRKNGTEFIDENNQTAFGGPLSGYRYFAYQDLTLSRNYVKGDTLILTFSFQDLNPLINKSALPCPELATVKIAHPPVDLDSGPCAPRILPVKPTPHKTTTRRTTPPRTTPPRTTPPRTTPPRTTPPRTTHPRTMPPKTTDDKSVFGFSPAMVASPVLTLLLALMLSMP